MCANNTLYKLLRKIYNSHDTCFFIYVVVNNKWILPNQKMDDHELRDIKISSQAIKTYQGIISLSQYFEPMESTFSSPFS